MFNDITGIGLSIFNYILVIVKASQMRGETNYIKHINLTLIRRRLHPQQTAHAPLPRLF